jgi:hypothetical protein
MKKVTMYQASNGACFDNEDDARSEEVRVVLIKCMENNTHCGETFTKDAAEEIMLRLDVQLKDSDDSSA